MECKTYAFGLDNSGNEQHMKLATDQDVSKALDQGRGNGEETSPSEVLHNLALAEQDRFQSMDYQTAVKRVLNKNVQLARLYASENNGAVRVVASP